MTHSLWFDMQNYMNVETVMLREKRPLVDIILNSYPTRLAGGSVV